MDNLNTNKHFIKRHPKAIITLLIIVSSILLINLIFYTRPTITKRAPDEYIPVVHFIDAKPGTVNIPVYARGFLKPEKEAQISSKVSGTIIEISENFAVGASFKKGDILLKIDPAQLKMELDKARANYEQAHLKELEINANLDAKSSLNKNRNLSELAQGTPQRAVAKANTEAALSALKLAQNQLEDATLRAPFDGKVMMLMVEEHELLTPGKPLAKIYSSDSFIVRLSVTEEQLAFIDLLNTDREKIEVTINHPTTNTQWKGHVLRSEGYVSKSRLIYLIVKIIPDTNSTAPLPGTLVEAEIVGKSFDNVLVVPTKALKSQNTIWTLDDDNRLKIVPASVIHRGPKKAFIQADISNSRIITSHLASITAGMKLKPIAQKSPNSTYSAEQKEAGKL